MLLTEKSVIPFYIQALNIQSVKEALSPPKALP